MCEAVTIAYAVAAVAAVAAGGVSAYGQYQAGKAESNAAKYNAKMAEFQAQDTERRGVAEQAEHARKVSQLKAQQRATMASNGLDLTSETPMEIFQQTAEWGERDRQTIEHNTAMEAWANRAQVNLFNSKAKNAKMAGNIGATGTLLSSASSALFSGAGAMGGGGGVSEASGGYSKTTANGNFVGGSAW